MLSNKIPNKIFWSYFGGAIVILLFIAILSTINQKLQDFIECYASFKNASRFCILTVVSILPTIVISALSVAFYTRFRMVEDKLLLSLAKSLVVILPFAAAVWVYDTHVQWQVSGKLLDTMWSIQRYDRYSTTTFTNRTAFTSERSVIYHRIDSLQNVYDKEVELGTADYSYETRSTLDEYRYEAIKRNITAIVLIVLSLIFAMLGYFTRRVSFWKITVIVAVVVLCVYLIAGILNVTKRHSRNISYHTSNFLRDQLSSPR